MPFYIKGDVDLAFGADSLFGEMYMDCWIQLIIEWTIRPSPRTYLVCMSCVGVGISRTNIGQAIIRIHQKF